MKSTAIETSVPGAPAPAGRAFTLIELLVVISIIGLLAAFTLAGVGVVTKNKYISTAKAEMASIQAALERYKSVYGFYPPCNATNILVQPLYFELQGATNGIVGGAPAFIDLDGRYSVAAANIRNSLGVDGIINVTKGGGDDLILARSFLPDLKATQIGIVTNPVGSGNPGVPIIITAAGGPDVTYTPLGASSLNPWRYNSVNPTNNPGAYDLYVQL